MAPPTAAERAAAKSQQRAAKQKKILLVLVPVLIALVAWQGPKLMKQLKGDEAAAPAAAETTASESALPAPAPAAAGELTDPAAVAPGDVPLVNPNDPEAVAAATRSLPNSEQLPAAAENQLIAFSRFEASDPFVQLVEESDEASNTDAPPAAPPPTSGTGTTPPPTSTTPPTSTPTSVTMSINLRVEILAVGATFPTNDPAFKIVAIHSDSVEIGIADGSFSDGPSTITVKKGEEVTLVSQPDGARFTLKVIEIN